MLSQAVGGWLAYIPTRVCSKIRDSVPCAKCVIKGKDINTHDSSDFFRLHTGEEGDLATALDPAGISADISDASDDSDVADAAEVPAVGEMNCVHEQERPLPVVLLTQADVDGLYPCSLPSFSSDFIYRRYLSVASYISFNTFSRGFYFVAHYISLAYLRGGHL